MCHRLIISSITDPILKVKFKRMKNFKNMKNIIFFIVSACCMTSISAHRGSGGSGMLDELKEVCSSSSPSTFAVRILQRFFANNVTVEKANYLGRPALKVAFTDAHQSFVLANGAPNGYVTVPFTNFFEGTIDVDIAAERNKYADENSRAFAGMAFRYFPTIEKNTYDLVYLRMTNGLLNDPPPVGERAVRAIQYVSPPKWEFLNLREQFPGIYEAGAKIAEKRWNHLRIQVKNNTFSAFIDWDMKPVLQRRLLENNRRGPIRLWVGDSTDAYFSNLKIRSFF